MFSITVTGTDGTTSYHEIGTPEVTIGRGAGNQIVLKEQSISRHHARLVVKDGKLIIVDLKSSNGTFVNGCRMTAPLIIRSGDAVVIGEFRIDIEVALEPTLVQVRLPYVPSDDVEANLIDAIVRESDDANRLVYADWLEERGEAARAEFLRVQQALVAMNPADHDFHATTTRLRDLAREIDVRWRVRVARSRIERCDIGFDFECPNDWAALAATDRDDVRHCGACNKAVHYCGSVGEARSLAARGACVALDVAALRWNDDVDPPYGERVCRSCELDVGSEPSHCPRCGDEMPRYRMTVGMIA